MLLKCKMCGGDIEVVPGTTVGTCQYCGSTMTLPQIDSDKALRMYDRANTYRLNNEFDKAYDAYKAIVEEDEQAAEAYWGMLLSEYGIEYVEDPKTHKRIPTCHRTLTQSILESANYKLACQYADAESRFLYQEEAETIDKIQKHIMAVSSKEEPYDVFISYKELNDADGQRTEASVLAQEIYDVLTKEGVRVFFSRISLEDKLGADYEPCIYAALRSSKVLLLVATDPAQCDAVWVRNEWSRYLKFMEEDHNKTIVPVFKTMTAYEFPHELQRFQAQDMGKLGAMQDLVRGVLKLAEFDEKKKSASTTDVIVATMLKRAEESLQKKDWDKAAEYFNNVLDYDVNNVDAYIGRLLVERKCVSVDDLAQQTQSLEASENYKKLIGLCNKDQKEKFRTIEEKIQQNHAAAQVLQKKRNKRIAIASTAAVLAAAVAVGAYFTATKVIIPEKNYKAAIASYDSGDYETAIKYFENHLDYRDSAAYLDNSYYQTALIAVNDGDYETAQEISAQISDAQSDLCTEIDYQIAYGYASQHEYEQAAGCYGNLNGYKDSDDQAAEMKTLWHRQLAESLVSAEVGDTVTFGTYEQDNDLSNGDEAINWVVLDRTEDRALLLSTKGLDCQFFNETRTDTTWETSTLRTWLNSTFIDQAFNAEDQGSILTSTVSADPNPEFLTDPGNATEDKLFLLSASEVNQYLATKEMRDYLRCVPTKFAVANGAGIATAGVLQGGWWWLRTPGIEATEVMLVNSTGAMSSSGVGVQYTGNEVRPAMWVSLNAQ